MGTDGHEPVVARLREALDVALAARDRVSAVQAALDAVRSGDLDVETLYARVLVPLLQDTGAAWQSGAQKVWEEHYATATVRTIVDSLYLDVVARADAVPRSGRVAVLACPPGEQHELGLRMLADRLVLHGWDAHFLGADTPVEEIAAAARELRADVVALSAATHYNRMLLRDVLARLHRELPDVRVGVGGPAFANDPELAAEVLTEADLGLGPNAVDAQSGA